MSKKIIRGFRTNMALYSLCLLAFVIVTIPVEPLLAAGEALAAVVVLLLGNRRNKMAQASVRQYMDRVSGGMDSARSSNMLYAPLPMLVFDVNTGEVLWSNDMFLQLTSQKEKIFEMLVDTVVPDFSYRWLLEGKREYPELFPWNGRIYRVFGSLSHPEEIERDQTPLATTYWMDVTDSEEMRQTLELTRPLVAILMVDNYEELMKACPESKRSAVLAALEEKLNDWAAGSGGLLLSYDRDRYLFVFEEKDYGGYTESKFDVLEKVRQVQAGEGVSAALSIGVGRDADSFEALFKNASVALEMALSRGGDQAVVKDKLNFEFYGGRSKATEKRTKVKSRVMANALGELMDDAKQVYVMGHKYADMDSVGAAMGVCCIARKRGKKCQIVIDTENNAAHPLIRKMAEQPEYAGVMISGGEAFLKCQPGALLVVVDTNRPESVESEETSAGRLQPGGGHRPPPPGQQLHRQDGPELPRALRLLRQRAGDRTNAVSGGALRCAEMRSGGTAGGHCAGYQELYQPYRRPHLRGGGLPAAHRRRYPGCAALVPGRPAVHGRPVRHHPAGGAVPRRHCRGGAGGRVRPRDGGQGGG